MLSIHVQCHWNTRMSISRSVFTNLVQNKTKSDETIWRLYSINSVSRIIEVATGFSSGSSEIRKLPKTSSDSALISLTEKRINPETNIPRGVTLLAVGEVVDLRELGVRKTAKTLIKSPKCGRYDTSRRISMPSA